MHIQIIVGSVRKGRVARKVADWCLEACEKLQDTTSEIVDLVDWELPFFNLEESPITNNYSDKTQIRWAKKIEKADGFIFVSPEYNHGYSAVVKNAIDFLYKEWNKKPATIVTYGGVEGARSAEQLRLVMIEVQMVPLRDAVHIRDVWGKIKDSGFKAEEKDNEQLEKALDTLYEWGDILHEKSLHNHYLHKLTQTTATEGDMQH